MSVCKMVKAMVKLATSKCRTRARKEWKRKRTLLPYLGFRVRCNARQRGAPSGEAAPDPTRTVDVLSSPQDADKLLMSI